MAGDVPAPPGPTRAAIDTAVRHQVYLERVASGLAEPIQEAVAEMARGMADYVIQQELELSGMEPTKAMRVVKAAKNVAELDGLMKSLDDLVAQLSEVSDYEGAFQARALQAAAKKVRVKTLEAGTAFDEALATPLTATGQLMEQTIKKWAQTEVDAVGEVIAQGYSQGRTNAEIARAIRGTKAANYKDGVMPRLGRNADAVVRTSVQHVARTARDLTYAENSDIIQGVRYVATLDSHTTQQCKSLDGREFPLDKGPRPPLHWRCRSTTVPILISAFRFLEEGQMRSSEFGPVPAKQTYYMWLGDQPPEFQDDALGPVRGKLFRDGGLTAEEFSRLNLDRKFQPLSLAEMKKKEPTAFQRAGL